MNTSKEQEKEAIGKEVENEAISNKQEKEVEIPSDGRPIVSNGPSFLSKMLSV